MEKQKKFRSGFTIVELLVTIAVIVTLSSAVFLGHQNFNSYSILRVRTDDLLSSVRLTQSFASSSLSTNIEKHKTSVYALRIKKPTTEDSQTSYRIEKITNGIDISSTKTINFATFDSSEIVYGPELVEKSIKFTPCFIVKNNIQTVYVDNVEVCYDSKENLPEGFFEENKVKEVLIVFVFPFREPTVFLSTYTNKNYPSKKQFFDGNNKIIGAKLNLSIESKQTIYSIDILKTGALFLNRIDID